MGHRRGRQDARKQTVAGVDTPMSEGTEEFTSFYCPACGAGFSSWGEPGGTMVCPCCDVLLDIEEEDGEMVLVYWSTTEET